MAAFTMINLLCFAIFYINFHLGNASPTPEDSVGLVYPRDVCSGNTPETRSQWCDFNLDTDYQAEAPDTGVTREYYLELTDVVVSPDGVQRSAMAINGSIPGPTIFADWGKHQDNLFIVFMVADKGLF